MPISGSSVAGGLASPTGIERPIYHAGALRLYAAVRDRFLPLLGEHFPDLVPRYQRAYARQAGAPKEYAKALSRRVEKLRRKHGFKNDTGMIDRYRRARMPVQGELELRGSLP